MFNRLRDRSTIVQTKPPCSHKGNLFGVTQSSISAFRFNKLRFFKETLVTSGAGIRQSHPIPNRRKVKYSTQSLFFRSVWWHLTLTASQRQLNFLKTFYFFQKLSFFSTENFSLRDTDRKFQRINSRWCTHKAATPLLRQLNSCKKLRKS